MTIFGQYKEKLKGIGGRKAWVKFRRNYEHLERFCARLCGEGRMGVENSRPPPLRCMGHTGGIPDLGARAAHFWLKRPWSGCARPWKLNFGIRRGAWVTISDKFRGYSKLSG